MDKRLVQDNGHGEADGGGQERVAVMPPVGSRSITANSAMLKASTTPTPTSTYT